MATEEHAEVAPVKVPPWPNKKESYEMDAVIGKELCVWVYTNSFSLV